MLPSPICAGSGELSVRKNQSVIATFFAELQLKHIVVEAIIMMVTIMMIYD